MPRTTCSEAGKNLAACRWRKHNKKKAKAKVQAEKAARAAAKAAKAAKAKKLQAAALNQKSKLPKKKLPKILSQSSSASMLPDV